MVNQKLHIHKFNNCLSGFHAKQYLITTDLYLFYLEAGLKITNLSVALEYPEVKPLVNFVKNITQKRKEAELAKDPQKQATYKLIANSAWGRLNMDQTKFRNRTIKQKDEEDDRDQFFCSSEIISSEYDTNYKELVRRKQTLIEKTPCES